MNSDNKTNQFFTSLLLISAATVFFILCYHDVISWWYHRCSGIDSYYSHGFLIPFVSAYLIWRKKNKIEKIKPECSLWGLVIIIFSALMHISGTILYVFSLSGFSIFFLFIGISLFIYGRQITRVIIFPLLFLVFMFPLPLAVLSAISFPMKLLVTKAGVNVIRLLDIPVFSEGFQVTIPAGVLLVGNPCSGLRSLISFLALGAVFAYLIDTSNFKKWILFVLAVPVALLSNLVRVPILILISHYWGLEYAEPESFWHDASGIFVFVLGFFLLLFCLRILENK